MTIKQQGGIFGRNPTFNNVDVEGTLTVNGDPISDFGTMAQQDADAVAITGGDGDFDNLTVDGNVLYVDSINNRVGINTSTVDEALHIEGSLSGAIMGLKIQNNNLDANSRAGIKMETANGTWTFAASRSGGCALIGPLGEAWTTNNTGNLAFPSGQGIDFSATSGTGTSELFSDYEEGVWSPVVASGSIAGTGITYSGRYTKIGDTVTVYFQAATTGAVNDLVVASYVGLSGLPFAVASNLTSSGYSTTEDIDRSLGGEANVNGSILYLGACGSGSFTSKISATITYFTS
jgi:hypothetical protein